jgi:hypothetical protein
MSNNKQKDPRADAITSEQARLDRINSIMVWNRIKFLSKQQRVELFEVGSNRDDNTPAVDVEGDDTHEA